MKFKVSLMMVLSMVPMAAALLLMMNSTFISMEMILMSSSFFSFKMSLLMDWFSMLFSFTIMFISSMIMMYSTKYIPTSEHKKFSTILIIFILSMLLLTMSNNLIFILLGWDGLGLSSFILVIYYQNSKSSASGIITLMTNRLGDILLILSISMLTITSTWNFTMKEEIPMLIMIMISLAACTKSAQFPFSAWLPEAMAAPTPISALVHSSTLVTAGIFLMTRLMNFNQSTSMTMLMITSSLTTIMSSMAANWEQDMKKIIALSTLSQIAMMMFALSLNNMNIAFFHLITHAMFKSMMFLCAGMMIHNSSYQDMRNMSLPSNNSPIMMTTLGISSMALMGIPFMSGFFSKDMILESMIEMNMLKMTSMMMMISVGMTAIYSIRMSFNSFKMQISSKPDMNFSPPLEMEIPIMLMAPMSIFMGSSMSWTAHPQQMFMIPFSVKMLTMMMIVTGMTIGMALSFNSKKYKKTGKTAISLWFTHLMSTSFLNPLMTSSTHLLLNDKKWQENYGPSNMYLFLKKKSSIPMKINMSLLFILMISTTFPLMILII